jgi:hypothetical protein
MPSASPCCYGYQRICRYQRYRHHHHIIVTFPSSLRTYHRRRRFHVIANVSYPSSSLSRLIAIFTSSASSRIHRYIIVSSFARSRSHSR